MKLNRTQSAFGIAILVLGVWGVRAILAGTEKPGSTALDLALSVVILFLLGGVTARMLHYLDHRSGFRLLQRTVLGSPSSGPGESPQPGSDDTDAVGTTDGREPARAVAPSTAKHGTKPRVSAQHRARRAR